jgi:hypothetical protein
MGIDEFGPIGGGNGWGTVIREQSDELNWNWRLMPNGLSNGIR